MALNARLVVPSRERANWLMGRQTNTLLKVGHLNPIVYVRSDDSQMKAYEALVTKYGGHIVIQNPSALGAAQTYDSLIDKAVADGVEHLIILDDDLTFRAFNWLDDSQQTIGIPARSMEAVLNLFSAMTCPELPACSFTPITKRSQRMGVNYASPLMWTYSFYIPHFAEHPEHRYWQGKEIEARCDLNLALNLLTSGYLTAYMTRLFIVDNVNNPGGCSTYRSIELERQSVDYLKRKYPRFVSTHKMHGWVGDENVERDAPVVKYKQAFNDKAFCHNFGYDRVADFCNRHLKEHVERYELFCEEDRNAVN